MIQAEQWFPDKPVEGVVQPKPSSMTQFAPYIRTLEGDHLVSSGDWIITGIVGEKYCCKNHIFKDIYVPTDEESAIALGWESLEDYDTQNIVITREDEANG